MEKTKPPFARDLELIREILIWMESGAPDNSQPSADDEKRFAYHCQLMDEIQLIKAAIMTRPGNNGMMEAQRAVVQKLLWKGQETLEAMRNDTVWNKTKAVMTDKGIPALFDVIVAAAKGYAKQAGVALE